ncbi:uncharacterized protein JN550_004794 [Neoarthrinium moseri]|uniref:uncharacterized protein n=1 Tax=Neoarthrinium moseri TaxID=1658444 RepID=UPI001FDD8574|nr:uncharacterized protein JN550_004794 [Neoarthrinium moseri]KAI1871349.1 hypothetical protein JN550_004794 [Neoarthrinium moseri]
MSGFSTPKRQFDELTEDIVRSEDHGSIAPKRNKLKIPTTQPRDGLTPLTEYSLSNLQYASAQPISSFRAPDEIICFGMLKGIQIRFNVALHAHSINSDSFEGENDTFTSLELQIANDRCDIAVKGNLVATMNRRTHFALNSLSCAREIQLTGMMPRSEFQKKLKESMVHTGAKAQDLACVMAISVLGSRAIAQPVAKDLSKHHLFLQHPQPIPSHVPYENPQYLDMVRSSFSNGALLPPISVETLSQERDQSGDLDQSEDVDLAAEMDNLPRHDYLTEVNPDSRITVELLSHQKEALDFVRHRETVGGIKARSLWRPEYAAGRPALFKHVITGSSSAKPEDSPGGILADGMGLGKTLTMIASIVAGISHTEDIEMKNQDEDKEATTTLMPIQSTLVVVPSLSLLDGWVDEIKKHVSHGSLAYYKYHGPKRMLPSSSPPPYHIVLTTYGTVAADARRGGGVLSCFHWYRIILDEAHVIRNGSTSQFKAVVSLSASVRWCMTGTPMQNSLEDLLSLLKFLRIPMLSDARTFRRYIAGNGKMTSGVSKPNYENLRLLLGSICLRRCTSAVLSSIGVSFVKHRPCLSAADRAAYDELAAKCKKSILAGVSGRPFNGISKSIMAAILRLRIFCNTGQLVGPMEGGILDEGLESQFEPDEMVSLLQQSGDTICADCSSEILLSLRPEDAVERHHGILRCRSKCQACAQRSANTDGTERVLGDREILNVEATPCDAMEDVQYGDDSSTMPSHTLTGAQYPAKLEALLADVKEYNLAEKSIVFSFWRRSLNLVSKLFRNEGIDFRRVDGDIKTSARRHIFNEFRDNPSVRVLLMTIGTGAVGLNNLSVASRVHILEPQWNPSMEDQAIGRVFRLGQTQQVCVIRYIVDKTVEESIESRQGFKLQLALKSGLHSSEQQNRRSRRNAQLQALSEIIRPT